MPPNVSFRITSREADEPRAQCTICSEWMPLELILGHLAGAHDVEVELETWSDGDPVVIDATLEPKDFEP